MNRIEHFDKLDEPMNITRQEWSSDIGNSYWRGVADGQADGARTERRYGAMRWGDLLIGIALGVALSSLAYLASQSPVCF